MAQEHFLAHLMEGESTFRAEPWYNAHGDCLVYKMADEAAVAERIDDLLTLYRSAEDERPIGFQIKGVYALIQRLGVDGLAVMSKTSPQCVKSISVVALLLAAYEEQSPTLSRRMGYTAAMESGMGAGHRTISARELQLN